MCCGRKDKNQESIGGDGFGAKNITWYKHNSPHITPEFGLKFLHIFYAPGLVASACYSTTSLAPEWLCCKHLTRCVKMPFVFMLLQGHY